MAKPNPICRWKNTFLHNVKDLISFLPKEEMQLIKAKEIINRRFRGDFFHTASQLASQLGLFYKTNDLYFPKFTFNPSELEIRKYMSNWLIHYCVPNPYTDRFVGTSPFSIHSKICGIIHRYKKPLPWKSIINEVFGEPIGNEDILINSLNDYSEVLEIKNNLVQVKNSRGYDVLKKYTYAEVNIDRNDNETFFDLFAIQTQKEIISDISEGESKIIEKIINKKGLSETEKNQIIKARKGQGRFRRDLIKDCGYCPISQIDNTNLLVASHIKPWRSSNNHERLNPKNGILFTPTYDKLFDKGLISFNNDKSLIISPKLSFQDQKLLNIVDKMDIPAFPVSGREMFLEYHRKKILMI